MPEDHISPECPFPPRYWWLKRIGIGTAGLLLGLAALWMAWNWDANRRLRNQIALIHSRGEPTTLAELDGPQLPDEDNAVYWIKSAVGALNWNAESPSQSIESFPRFLPMPPLWHEMAIKAIKGNQAALKDAAQLLDHPQADWRVDSPHPPRMSQTILDSRALANLLIDTALYEHLHGDEAAAIHHTRQVLAVGDAVAQSPSLLMYLVGTGINSLACSRLEMMAPDLRAADIGPDGGPSASKDLVGREEIQSIIAYLLDGRYDDGLYRAYLGEPPIMQQTYDRFSQQATVLRPMFRLDTLRALREAELTIRLAKGPQYWQAKKQPPTRDEVSMNLLTGLPESPQSARILSRPLTSMSTLLPRVFQVELTRRTLRRMTAVSLAMRLYRLDHHDEWPADLRALVPDYLTMVPKDPFSETGAPLRLVLLDAGRRPVIYTVGPDGVEAALPPDEVSKIPHYGSDVDHQRWLDLSRVVPPSTNPAKPDQDR